MSYRSAPTEAADGRARGRRRRRRRRLHGLWTALALRERDPSPRVALLEAREVGEGPSGRNGGFLHGYWSSLPTLRRALGTPARSTLPTSPPGSSPPCEPSWSSAARTSGCTRAAPEGRRQRRGGAPSSAPQPPRAPCARTRRRCRSRVTTFAAGSTRRASSAASSSGRRDRPARPARAGAEAGRPRRRRAALRADAGDGYPSAELDTPTGAVHADELVLALNAWGTGWPLGRRQTTFASAVVLTEPVPELLEQIAWTGGEAVTDGRMFLHYSHHAGRPRADGQRLRTARAGRPRRPRRARRRRRPGPRARRATLAPPRSRRRAHRSALERPDRRLRRPAAALRHRAEDADPLRGRLLGNGVGPSWLGGQILASLALGTRDEWSSLPLVERPARRLPPEPLRYVGGRLVRWGTLSVEESHGAGRRPHRRPPWPPRSPRLLRMPIGVR